MNNFRKDCVFEICWDFWGPKWSPPPSSPASMSKFPSGGKMERNVLLRIFVIVMIVMKNESPMKHGTKMITSCSVRRVGRR